MLCYVVIAVMLLASDLVHARPKPQTKTTSSRKPIINDREAIDDLINFDVDAINHAINKREKSQSETSCRYTNVRKVMQSPTLFIELDSSKLTGLSPGSPSTNQYDECVFTGCTEEEIQHLKQSGTRIPVTFTYNPLPDLPDAPNDKPSYTLKYTKYITQCSVE